MAELFELVDRLCFLFIEMITFVFQMDKLLSDINTEIIAAVTGVPVFVITIIGLAKTVFTHLKK